MRRIFAVLTTLCALAVLATHSGTLMAAPTKKCVDEIMIGKKINWGGGTVWARPNAERLCEGARSRAPIQCFEAQIKKGMHWDPAIGQCTQAALDNRPGAKVSGDSGTRHCMKEIMSGRVNWGGGTVWNPDNAANLCGPAGSDEDIHPARCFSAGIAQGLGWPESISICRRPAMDAKNHCVQKSVKNVWGIDEKGKKIKPQNLMDMYTWQLAFHKCGIGGEPHGLVHARLMETKCGEKVGSVLGTTHLMSLCGYSLYDNNPISADCFKTSVDVLKNGKYAQLVPKWNKNNPNPLILNELAIDLCRHAENNRTLRETGNNSRLINRDCLVAGLNRGIPAARVVGEFCRNDNDGVPVNRCILNGDGNGGKPSSNYHGPIFNNHGEYINTFKDGFDHCV